MTELEERIERLTNHLIATHGTDDWAAIPWNCAQCTVLYGLYEYALRAENSQLTPPCWVCGKQWKRSESSQWLFFDDMLVCTSHRGAQKWYDGVVELANEKLIVTLEQQIERKQE